MAIPESQFETWAKLGAAKQSRDTYATVKNALEDKASPYASKDFITYLQGSYGNDTNVYRDSDVDVVIQLNSTFYHDAYTLVEAQRTAFEKAYPGTAAYTHEQFKADVATWLKKSSEIK
jgi:tRNA nucleotidyltransferase (CCA-adding enzyme)